MQNCSRIVVELLAFVAVEGKERLVKQRESREGMSGVNWRFLSDQNERVGSLVSLCSRWFAPNRNEMKRPAGRYA